jgi:subtilisin family serine protease
MKSSRCTVPGRLFRRPLLCASALAALVAASLAAAAGEAPRPLPSLAPPSPPKARVRPAFDADTVLLRTRPGVSRVRLGRLLAMRGDRLGPAIGSTGFTVVAVKDSPRRAVRELAAHPLVADVELNHVRRAAAEPNDPLYSSYQPYLAALRFPVAWDIARGASGLAIAIVDTGVDLDHPDLPAQGRVFGA